MRGCDARRSRTVPPASVALATTGMSGKVVPARTRRSAPGMLPSPMVTLAAVTVRPRSSSRPVPVCKLPNRAVVYQSVCHGVAGSPDSAREAPCGLSPSDVPPGPNAVALTGVTSDTGTAVGAGRGLAGPDAVAECGLGRGPPDAPGVRAAARPGDAREGVGDPPVPEVSRMATKPITARQSRYTSTASRPLPRGVRGGRSGSSSSVTGRPAGYAASYWPTSLQGSTPTTAAIARMCPRA